MAVAETERAWLDAARGKTLRESETLVARTTVKIGNRDTLGSLFGSRDR